MDRATTTLAMTALHGGMQQGNNNNIYTNCTINYITYNCKQCHPAEEHVVSEDTPRDLMLSSSLHTTPSVRAVDCRGRELQLGDFVTGADMAYIYAGDRMIIGVNETTGRIVLEAINVDNPLFSFSPPLGKPTYSPIESVKRAMWMIGQKFDDGPVGFLHWCYKDRTFEEWFIRNREILDSIRFQTSQMYGH